jgi:hypothetical protein
MDESNPESDGVFATSVSLYTQISVGLADNWLNSSSRGTSAMGRYRRAQQSDEEFTSGAWAASRS